MFLLAFIVWKLAITPLPQANNGIGPKPIGGAGSLFRVGDIPVSGVRMNRDTVRIALTIDADGSPISCKIIISSGNRNLDETTCLSSLKRGHFIPARDEELTPITSVWPTTVKWGESHPHLEEQINASDIVLTVSKLPTGSLLPVEVREIIDSKGNQRSCSSNEASLYLPYESLACNMLAKLQGRAEKDRSGRPVKTMVISRVLFTSTPLAIASSGAGRIFRITDR
ncbi:energy transducer TonB family protein [Sphingomonas sp. PAMC 26617]|uniref:energy transducer TonB family protein n=1 Tax=Sphingomonas sp. PAMC 26617 TaxID=1112216 RepID=UPI0012F4BB78|nr:energy transducer TonB [Sphingomonas sp. PAMC 26617]